MLKKSDARPDGAGRGPQPTEMSRQSLAFALSVFVWLFFALFNVLKTICGFY